MIKRKEQMKIRIAEKVFGGEGKLQFLDLFEKEETQGLTRIFSIVTLEEGCSIGPHTHRGEAEIYFLLEGAAQTLSDGQWVDIKEGDGAFTPEGKEHAIRNPHKEKVRLLAVIIEGDSC
ncbi:MAG: cupin domain-containing protein [Tissierellia bacterium]|nr:cupin domain-containing protein [Tissierellia bacterium]